MNQRDMERGAAVAWALHLLRSIGLTASVSVEYNAGRSDDALEGLSISLPGYRDAIVIWRNPGETIEAYKQHLEFSIGSWKPKWRPDESWRYDRQPPVPRSL